MDVKLVSIATVLGLSSACGPLSLLAGDLVEPLVVVGVVIDVPEGETAVIDDLVLESGTSFYGYVADARAVGNLDQAGVEGAVVEIDGRLGEDMGGGAYAVFSHAGLHYRDADTWELVVTTEEHFGTAAVWLPPPVSWAPPSPHSTGADLVVDLSPEPVDAALVTVVDVLGDQVTWSNEPRSPAALFTAVHSDGASASVMIPGEEAFPEDAPYRVGIFGAARTRAADVEGLNSALSAVLAGRLVVRGLDTTSGTER